MDERDTPPAGGDRRDAADANKAWSVDDDSLKRQERNGLLDPDEGLRSHESEALGTDRYRDPLADKEGFDHVSH